MASALSSTPGATMAAMARNACSRLWASGWFMQSVPSRFHRKAVESRRNTSIPLLARPSMAPAMAAKTAGLA
ncbi:hypothetical protein D3C72_2507590 [compost metagenome]